MAKRGRKTMCTPERVATICKAIENGETKARACELGGITTNTFWTWYKTKNDFADAVKKAEERYAEWERNGILQDAVKSLKTLICGTDYEEVRTEYEDKEGTPRIKKQTRITKHIMPNPTAVIFALVNRDPEHWQNRVTNTLEGKIETESQSNVSLATIPDGLLEQVIDALTQQ